MGQRVQQGRFAAVRVADDGDHRIGDAPASLTAQGALLADLLDVPVELADAMANAPPVALELLLAGAAGAHACAQAREVATTLEAGQEVMQLRGLHLQAALLGAGALSKDVENQLGAVDHLDIELALEVALLARGQFLVEDQQVEIGLVFQRVQFLDLALSQEERGIRFWAALRVGTNHDHASRSRQLAQLEHLLFHGGQPLVLVIERHQVGTLVPAIGVPDQLASAVMIPAPSRAIASSRSGGIQVTRESARNQVSWRRAYWRTWRTVEMHAASSESAPSMKAAISG